MGAYGRGSAVLSLREPWEVLEGAEWELPREGEKVFWAVGKV